MASSIVLQKNTVEELEEMLKILERDFAEKELIEQTSPCYTGSLLPICLDTLRPSGFIGPLEVDLLPDSVERRFMWIASLCHTREDFYGVTIPMIPGIELVREVAQRELLTFPDHIRPAEKNCVDEALQGEAFYEEVCKSYRTYGSFRDRVFNTKDKVVELLQEMGYKEVQNSSPGDLVVYFSNVSENPLRTNRFYVYGEERMSGHFGRVVRPMEDTVRVRSKFGTSHVYEHRIDEIPYFFGNSYLIFSKAKAILDPV